MPAKKAKKKPASSDPLVCRNPKASKRYAIEERYEAGLVLMGSEVKSLRARRADLDGAYATIEREEAFLVNMHIAPYEQATREMHEPRRRRKLLMHRRELDKLQGRLTTQGYALVPTKVYFRRGVAKVELGLGRGRKQGDNREAIRKKLDVREAREAMKRD